MKKENNSTSGLLNFIKANICYWSKSRNVARNDSVILVEERAFPNQIIPMSIIAKVLENNGNSIPLVVTSNNSTYDKIKNIYNSFGIVNFYIIKNNVFSSLVIPIKIFLSVVYIILDFIYHKCDFNWFVSNLKIDNVYFGDAIYDEYIRRNSTFSNLYKHLFKLFKIIIYSVTKYHITKDLFDRYRVTSVIISTTFYINNGMFLQRVALNRGIRVILSKGRDVPKVYKNKDDIFVGMNNVDSSNVEDLQFTLSKQHVLEKYLTDRLNGNILNSDFDTDNAYNNKKKWSLEKLLNYYGGDFKIDNEVAFIYLHALSDANHCSGKLLFRDYYSWFTETVAFIKNIKSVNWIIKPHPSSSVYNESGIVEDVLAQIGANNIFLSPNNISNKSVFKISKTVITVSGTIGIEAACFGLRPILAGVSNYSGFGFTIDCKTKEEYFENLTNLDNSLRPLCEKEILLAKKVMYLYHIGLDLNSDILLDDSCLIPGEDLKNDGLVDGIYGEVSNNLSKYKYEDDPFYKYVEKMVQAI